MKTRSIFRQIVLRERILPLLFLSFFFFPSFSASSSSSSLLLFSLLTTAKRRTSHEINEHEEETEVSFSNLAKWKTRGYGVVCYYLRGSLIGMKLLLTQSFRPVSI